MAFVEAISQHDRVWITFFESDCRDFAEKPLGRDALLPDRNFESLAKLGTGESDGDRVNLSEGPEDS